MRLRRSQELEEERWWCHCPCHRLSAQWTLTSRDGRWVEDGRALTLPIPLCPERQNPVAHKVSDLRLRLLHPIYLLLPLLLLLLEFYRHEVLELQTLHCHPVLPEGGEEREDIDVLHLLRQTNQLLILNPRHLNHLRSQLLLLPMAHRSVRRSRMIQILERKEM